MLLSRWRTACVFAANTAVTSLAVPERCFAECWIESFPVMIVSLLNGGPAFAGKSGRNNANACDTNAIQTIVIAAAHFMSRGLIKLQKRDKKIFAWR